MRRPVRIRILSLAFALAASLAAAMAAAAGTSATPEPKGVPEAREALVAAREEVSRAKDAWDKSKLEATLWDQRYKRAYQEWVKSKGEARDAALQRRLRSEEDLKVAIEVRRLDWYRYELARRRVQQAEEALKTLELESEMRAVEERLNDLQDKMRATPAPTVTPAERPKR